MKLQRRTSSSPRWVRAVASLLIVGFVTLTTGCGNSQDDFVFTSTPPQNGAPADGFFMGRVLLDNYREGDQVRVTDLEDNTLYTLTTNSAGVFYTYGPLPQDFRIHAQRTGENTVHTREIRGGYHGGTMYVHPLTTLASRFLEANPGASLEQANEAVGDHFDLPDGFNPDWVTNAEVSPFRPIVFYQQAAQNGGLAAYYDLVEEQINNPTLNAEVAESAGAKLTKEIAGDLLGDTVSLLDAGAFGAVTQFFGLNLGTSGALNAISEQLDEVLNELTQLESEVNASGISGQYTTDRDAMQTSLDNISNYAKSVQLAAEGGPPSFNLATLLLIEDNMQQLRSYLVDTPANGVTAADNIVYTYAEFADTNGVQGYKMNLSDTSSYQSYAVRINGLTDLLQKNLEVYLNYLSQAVNNRAELAHMSVPPAAAIDAARSDIEDAVADTLQAVAQVPDKLSSDDFLVDMQVGQMWVANFQSQSNYYDAHNLADNWSEGGYDDWRLPGRSDIDNFVQNRIGRAKSSDDNDGWKAGFAAFGFNTGNYGKQKYDGGSGLFGNTDVQGQAFFDIDTDDGANNQNVYQWSGVNSTPATSYYNDFQGDTEYSSTFLIFRYYAGSPEGGRTANVFAYATLPSSGNLAVTNSGNQLTAKTTLDAKGITTPSIDVTTRTYWKNVSSSSALKAMATISNYAGDGQGATSINLGAPGFITWHPPIDGSPLQPVSIQGTLWGPTYGGSSGSGPQAVSSMTGTITVNPPSGLTPNATSLQLVTNKIASNSGDDELSNEVDTTQIGNGIAQDFDVYATTFYQDGQYHDVTGLIAEYQLLNSQNVVVASTASGGGFIDTVKNRLVVYNTLPAGTYTIRAQYTTPTGQSLTGNVSLIVDGTVN